MKTILVLAAMVTLFSCNRYNREKIEPRMQRVQEKINEISNKYRFTITATKVPYLFKRINSKGAWVTTTCTEYHTVILEEYVDPNKIIGGTSFKEYMFMASFNMTDNGKETITITCDHQGKSVSATNNGATVAMLQLKNLKQ